jgi:hypothetical protein
MGYFKQPIRRSRCRDVVRSALTATALVGTRSVGARRSSRELYLRFSAGSVNPDSSQQCGIFHIGDDFAHTLTHSQSDLLEESYAWFNKNLVVPDLNQPRAIFWFRASGAGGCVQRLWDQVYLLRDNGIVVRVLRCRNPGLIVYRDDQQIAAIPQRSVNWRYRLL